MAREVALGLGVVVLAGLGWLGLGSL